MKKILFVATVDIHIINFHLHIIKKLREEGHIVDVASSGEFTNEDINKKFNICFSKNPLSLNNIKAHLKIKKIMKNNNYDIISCHTPLSSFFTRMATSVRSKTKVIYTAHGFHFFKGSSFVSNLIYKNMEKIAARKTDILVTINEEDYAMAKTFKLKKNGIVKYIPGIGVDLECIKNIVVDKSLKRKILGIDSDDFVILSVGEINNNKNHIFVIESLLEQFKVNNKLKYVICGVGPNKEKYENYIKENGLENQIKFIGYRKDVYEIYHISDLFIFPSKREGLPVSLIEAITSGLIPIVTNIRGSRDIVNNDYNGFVIELNDEEKLNSIVTNILNGKYDLDNLKENGQLSVQKYGYDIVVRQILGLYF